VHGYDEGPNFIDHSEIISRQGEAQTLNPAQFRIVLSYDPLVSAKLSATTPCSEEAFGELQAGLESFPSFLDRRSLMTSE
jgi:hypothetical protein